MEDLARRVEQLEALLNAVLAENVRLKARVAELEGQRNAVREGTADPQRRRAGEPDHREWSGGGKHWIGTFTFGSCAGRRAPFTGLFFFRWVRPSASRGPGPRTQDVAGFGSPESSGVHQRLGAILMIFDDVRSAGDLDMPLKNKRSLDFSRLLLVGTSGFEPPTPTVSR
jgi:hypothetical protein